MPIYQNDTLLVTEERPGECDAGKVESFEMTIYMPDHFFHNEEFKKMMPRVEYDDKHM